jgi:hypothetical protein
MPPSQDELLAEFLAWLRAKNLCLETSESAAEVVARFQQERKKI